LSFYFAGKPLTVKHYMTYDIELPNPFRLSIDIQETDEILPSFGCNVSVSLKLPRGDFSYSAKEIWFECSLFDKFISKLKELRDGQDVIAEFYDFDKEITYSMDQEKITVEINRSNSEAGTGNLKFETECRNEQVLQHIETLDGFAKWW
jgi:hypothetical protein